MSQERRSPVEVVRAHMEAEDRHDVEAALATFTEDCFYRVPGLGVELRGKGELRRWYQALFTAVPDFRNTDERYFAADRQVFYEASFTGTHLGEWEGWAPTGRRFSSAMLLRIPIAEDGLMAGEIVYADNAGLFMQLGILPKRGSQAERLLQSLHRWRMRLLR